MYLDHSHPKEVQLNDTWSSWRLLFLPAASPPASGVQCWMYNTPQGKKWLLGRSTLESGVFVGCIPAPQEEGHRKL